MKSVGEMLRRERIQSGLDLATLSSRTRISERYLEAIESGTAADLPGGFFYRSFVRQYATALGMDSDGLEAELERVRQADEPILTAALEELKFPLKTPDAIVTEENRRYLGSGRISTYLILLIAVLAGCSAFYVWWRNLETASASRRLGIMETQTAEAAGRVAEPAATPTPSDAAVANLESPSAEPGGSSQVSKPVAADPPAAPRASRKRHRRHAPPPHRKAQQQPARPTE
jgi:cytoskeletal protein RodZ